MLTEPIAVTIQVIEALDLLGVPYLIGGSLASSVHGIIRTTMDVDLVADLDARHAEPLVQLLGDAFYIDADSIREAIHHQRSFNVIHLESMFKVDIFIRKSRPFDQAQFDRRIRHTLSVDPEASAYVATAEDTILAKLEWYRMGGEVSDRQWNDIQNVLQVQSSQLDLTYLRTWAAQLGVSDLLDRALAEADLA